MDWLGRLQEARLLSIRHPSPSLSPFPPGAALDPIERRSPRCQSCSLVSSPRLLSHSTLKPWSRTRQNIRAKYEGGNTLVRYSLFPHHVLHPDARRTKCEFLTSAGPCCSRLSQLEWDEATPVVNDTSLYFCRHHHHHHPHHVKFYPPLPACLRPLSDATAAPGYFSALSILQRKMAGRQA